MPAPLNLGARRFGRLIVLSKAYSTAKVARKKWTCVCDCGKTVVVAQPELVKGDTRSCGCIRKEMLVKRNYRHGMVSTRAYRKWRSMWARVRHPVGKSACYSGITVCKRWMKFENFYADMGDPPPGKTLERKNGKKGYAKENCMWVPANEQAQNTSATRWVSLKGERMCLAEAARRVGVSKKVLSDRINKLGWSVSQALSTPKRKDKRTDGQ